MKKLILVSLGLIAGLISKAQTFTESKPAGGNFNPESGQLSGSIVVDGKTFEVYETQSGSPYVKALSEEGKTYPVWVGQPTEHQFEGRQVRQAKSGKYFVLKLTKAGYPHATYLEVN